MEKILEWAPPVWAMPEEIKALWLEGLRSGRFVQGHSCLGSGEKERCCLGVLIQVMLEADAIPLGWEGNLPEENNPELTVRKHESGDSIRGIIPVPWQDALGLTKPVSEEELKIDHIDPEDREIAHDFLINRNDAHDGKPEHWTFAQIADWVEKNL